MSLPFSDFSESEAYALYCVEEFDRVAFCCCNWVHEMLFGIPENIDFPIDSHSSCQREADSRLYRDILCCAERKSSLQYVQKHSVREVPLFWETSMTPLSQEKGNYVFVKSTALKDVFNHDPDRYHTDLYLDTLLNGCCEAILILHSPDNLEDYPEFIIQGFNRAFTDLTGYSPEHCVGKKVKAVFRKNNILTVSKVVAESLRQKRVSYGMMGLDMGTHICYCTVNAVPLYLETCVTVTLFLNNVTDELKERREMAEVDYSYDCFFNSSAYGMALVEITGPDKLRVERHNKAFDQFYTLYRDNQGKINLKEKIREITTEKKPLSLQLQIDFTAEQGKDGYAFYNLSAVPIIKNNKIERLLVTCIDSTEQLKLNKRSQAALTRREKEILQLAVQGLPNKYIAHKLSITEGTVRKITSNAYKKLEIASRTELMKYYLSDKNLRQVP